MFSIILKNAGFRRTCTPIFVQTRDFKRDVVPCDLDPSHPDSPFNQNTNNENQDNDKEDKLPLWVHNNFGLDIPDGTYIH
jgi:hypothetical protein